MRRNIKNLIIPAAFLAFLISFAIPSKVTFTYHRERIPEAIIRPETRLETTRRVCKEKFNGDELTRCAYDLLAMAWKESRYDCEAVGDGGRSQGCFQIQTKMHGVSVEDAQDYEKAARWTLERLVSHGYIKYRTIAIRSHNGSGEAAARYAEAVKQKSAQLEHRYDE